MSELRIENVNYRYKNAPRLALSSVSCVFQPGTVSAVVGPSGSGKTTLLSIMAGLDRPESGKVLLDDADLAGMNLDAYRRKDVSVIFQAFQLFPLLTVMENVCYPMELSGVPTKSARERAKTLLESVASGRRSSAASRPTSPAASSSGWRLPAPWPPGRGCSWPTSPRATWTGRTAGTWWSYSRAWPTRRATA